MLTNGQHQNNSVGDLCLFQEKRHPRIYQNFAHGMAHAWILVAKSKTMLVLNVRTFIPGVKIDFATSESCARAHHRA